MDLKVGETYVMKKAETSSDGGITYLKKGTHVRLVSIGGSRVLVQDLSDDALTDGIWSTYADNLVSREEYDAMVDDEEPEPLQLEKGGIYVMKRDELSGDGTRVYLKKGARVRVDSFGTLSVLVQDLSEDMVDDGVWLTSLDALVPLEDALEVGAVYYMGKPETNTRGDVTFLRKGAIVRLEVWGKDRVVVKDLTDTKTGDGVWYTNPEYLVPIDKPEGSVSREEAEASDKNRCCVKEEENKSIAPIVHLEDVVVIKNKHYVSDHQPIETMQANMTNEEFIGFLKGNIIKYACRCGKKDEPLKEAEKIKQYAEWLCVALSDGTIDPRS